MVLGARRLSCCWTDWFVSIRLSNRSNSRGNLYKVTFQGRYRGTDGAWTEFDYLTHANSIDQTLAEVKELFPLAAELAGKQRDSLIRIVAINRRFEFGLFHLDRRTILQFYRVGDTWRML